MRKSIVAAAMAGSLVAGGAIGAALFGPGPAGAQSSTPSTTVPAPGSRPNGGTFRGNEDPAHERGESAQREADEDAGRAFTGHHRGGGSNEDPAHEQGESAEREAQENAGGAGQPGSTTTPSTAPANG